MMYENANSFALDTFDKFEAEEHKDADEPFWRLYGVFLWENGCHARQPIVSADTYEELAMWCDLHNIKSPLSDAMLS